jgi:ABC-type glycerol-3-phosphate transport system permease component
LIDGCSRYGIFWRIMLPLAKPAIASVGVFYFFFVWNDFLYPFVVLQKQQLTTIPVAVYSLKGRYKIAWGIQTAALTMAVVPAVLAVMFFQKRIVSGLTAGAVKGG